MKEQDLVNFINWLIESKEAPKGASFEETISWINELSTSEDGKQMLNQLLNTYKKSNNMEFFKKGGKFDYLLCLKKGGNIQDCGCGKKIEKAQDGATVETIKKTYTEIPGTDIDGNTYFEPYVEYHTPNGTVTQFGKSYRSNYGLGQYLPSLPFGPAKWQHNKAERQYNRQELNKSHQRNQELLQARNLEVQQKYGPVGNEAPMMADGGEISRMGIQPKEEFTEAEKQALSDGTFYEEVTYPDGYSVIRMSSGSYGKNQRYPFIYSKMVAPDGSVLYQQDQYRNYPLINKSPKLVDINDISYNLGDGEAWFNKYKAAIDGKNLNSPRTKTNKENDLLEYQNGGEISQRDAVNQYPYASKQDVIKAMNQVGLNNKEARQAYRSSKREMRDLGLRGRSLRQAARYNLIDQVYPRAGMTEEEARRAMLDNMITKISYD